MEIYNCKDDQAHLTTVALLGSLQEYLKENLEMHHFEGDQAPPNSQTITRNSVDMQKNIVRATRHEVFFTR